MIGKCDKENIQVCQMDTDISVIQAEDFDRYYTN